MSDDPKYACPQCGNIEFITQPNTWDRYQAIDEKLCWQNIDSGNDEFKLYCRECGERAPLEFEDAAA